MTEREQRLQILKSNCPDSNSILSCAQKYIQTLEEKNYSKKTLVNRRHYLGYFIMWTKHNEITKPQEIRSATMDNYYNYLCQLKSNRTKDIISPISRHRNFKEVSLFIRWLKKKDYIISDPTAQVEIPSPPKSLPHNILSAQQIEHIINQTDIKSPLGIRDRAIMEVFYSTGIRACELIKLSLHDIDIERGILMVRQGKGNKDRVVPIGKRALQWTCKYIEQARNNSLDNTLFLSNKNQPFASPGYLNQLISKYKKKAGITKAGACHLFRHSMATEMLHNGADIRYIQEILGHEKLDTTEIYTKVNIDHLKRVYLESHPAERCAKPQIPEDVIIPKRQHVKVISATECNKIQHYSWAINNPDTSFKQLVAKYLLWMENRYSPFTIEDRSRTLQRFHDWCHENSITDPQKITKSTISYYQTHLYNYRNPTTNQALSPTTRNSKITDISKFMEWLCKNNYLLYNPTDEVEMSKVPKRLPQQVLSPEETQKILKQPDITTHFGIRDRALLELFYSTGIRRREAAKLKVQDIHFEQAVIQIIQGKGNKDRYIPVSQNTLDWLYQYIHTVRPTLLIGSNDNTLFFTKYGKPFTAKGMGHTITQYINAANINKTGSCYLFRHSMATQMLENGADIRYIKEILGHNQLESTQIYTKVSIKKLKEVHTQTHPAKPTPTKTAQALQELQQ